MSVPDVAFVWLETRGFRSFGTEVRRFELSAPLVVVHAGNSQGKTSLAEAVEFLLTGRSSRRDVFGGAKAEYNGSLRNAHLPDDADVWVAAGIRDENGVVYEVRRSLTADFASALDCTSTLTVDGVAVEQIPAFGLSLGDGVMGAPVLLQHTLRYVLSTEPKQRATYFKALLTLSDLDLLRQRVAAQRIPLEQEVDGPATAAVRALSGTAMGEHALFLLALDTGSNSIKDSLDAALLAAGETLGVRAKSVDELRGSLDQMMVARTDRLFPLTAFTSSSDMPDLPKELATGTYRKILEKIDQEVANLLPTVSALLAIPTYDHLDEVVDCPVCATPDALTPARIVELRRRLSANTSLETAAGELRRDIRVIKGQWEEWNSRIAGMVPLASSWNEATTEAARAKFLTLCGPDSAKLDGALGYVKELAVARGNLDAGVKAVGEWLGRVDKAVERRSAISEDQMGRLEDLRTTFRDLRDDDKALKELHDLVSPLLESECSTDGVAELLAVVDLSSLLTDELRDKATRAAVVKKLNSVDRALKKASAGVLDARFGEMSATIEKWWLSVRPDELVGFAGVKRRAAGAIFVNLVAALQSQEQSVAVERDALGVYSDSQLNALGLATFLARAELSGARTVVLDDPIPGSDGDHRLTFVQNTLGELLSRGQQVILTTYDPKLAEWAAAMHTDLEPLTFDLNLLDATLGTEPTQTSDPFSRFMLQAEDSLNAPTAAGRRSACNAYRSAGERLAKQIIATNRSAAGVPTSVADVGKEASQLGELVPLVRGFALTSDEGGKWTIMPKVLNPGSHDDDVASTLDLKQIKGNLRHLSKAHRKKWPDGLVL